MRVKWCELSLPRELFLWSGSINKSFLLLWKRINLRQRRFNIFVRPTLFHSQESSTPFLCQCLSPYIDQSLVSIFPKHMMTIGQSIWSPSLSILTTNLVAKPFNLLIFQKTNLDNDISYCNISINMTPNLVAQQITNSSTLTCHCVLLLVVVQLLRSIQIQYQSISIENLMLLEHKMIPFFFRQIVWKRQIKHIACDVFAWKRYIGQ